MHFVWALCVLIAAIVSNAKAERIVGGSTTTITEYPSIVQVDFGIAMVWTQSCAANILNERYLVSAAHCFEGILFSINNRRIRAGSSTRFTGGVVVYLRRRVNHPSYDSRRNMDHDISVIETSQLLVFSNSINSISIPPQGYALPDNSPVVHAGWGTTSSGGLASTLLRHVEIRSINRQLCADRYRARGLTVTNNMICAGILDVGGKDACQGDSGGPMYFTRTVLVGIVSWGIGCADARFLGVSANVASYTNWIRQIASEITVPGVSRDMVT